MDLLKQVAFGCARLLVVAAALGVVFGLAFGAINWLRTYGIPASSLGIASAQVMSPHVQLQVLQPLADAIAWYNTVFPGYSRFGSGFGIIIGALLSMAKCSNMQRPARMVVFVLGGFLIGGRLVMMLTSGVASVVVCGIVGGIICAIYCVRSEQPPRFQPLPLRRL